MADLSIAMLVYQRVHHHSPLKDATIVGTGPCARSLQHSAIRLDHWMDVVVAQGQEPLGG